VEENAFIFPAAQESCCPLSRAAEEGRDDLFPLALGLENQLTDLADSTPSPRPRECADRKALFMPQGPVLRRRTNIIGVSR
jgi:hypothetical protein